jgi:signal transduction histidine kinase
MLQAAGIQLDWHILASPPHVTEPSLGPEESLHVLRVAQEAITNAVKHAQASRIEARVSVGAGEAPELRVSISDNGRGFCSLQAAPGRGLRHMQQRALALGGWLAITSGDQGTHVELRVPLEGPGRSSAASTLGSGVHSISTQPRERASNTASARERTSSLR